MHIGDSREFFLAKIELFLKDLDLTEWEENFLTSIRSTIQERGKNAFLTQKQINVFMKISDTYDRNMADKVEIRRVKR